MKVNKKINCFEVFEHLGDTINYTTFVDMECWYSYGKAKHTLTCEWSKKITENCPVVCPSKDFN